MAGACDARPTRCYATLALASAQVGAASLRGWVVICPISCPSYPQQSGDAPTQDRVLVIWIQTQASDLGNLCVRKSYRVGSFVRTVRAKQDPPRANADYCLLDLAQDNDATDVEIEVVVLLRDADEAVDQPRIPTQIFRNGAKVAMSYPVVEVPSTVELTA